MKIFQVNEQAMKEFDTSPQVILAAAQGAKLSVEQGVPEYTGESGKSFYIPLLIPANTESGDKRIFEEFELLDPPATLLWQPFLSTGHDDAVIVGRIDSWELGDDGSVCEVRGVMDTGAYGREATRLAEGDYLRGVSADMDKADKEEVTSKDGEDTQEVIKKARVTGATLVAKPAFQEAKFFILPEFPTQVDETPLDPNGNFEEPTVKDEKSVLIASAAPMYPPESWFKNPQLSGPTPLTLNDDGQVFGHIATWNTNHISMAGRQKPPRSKNNYKYFRTGVIRTEEGTDVPVGQITLTGGHADPYLDAASAIKHYDSTESAVCDVSAGEDRYGIWVAGCLRPDVTESQIRSFRAAAPSGDWRNIGGRLELVAVCQVNVPGFPNTRTVTASGAVMSLCAAGTTDLLAMRVDPIEKRLENLEQASYQDKVDDALKDIASLEFDSIVASLTSN